MVRIDHLKYEQFLQLGEKMETFLLDAPQQVDSSDDDDDYVED